MSSDSTDTFINAARSHGEPKFALYSNRNTATAITVPVTPAKPPVGEIMVWLLTNSALNVGFMMHKSTTTATNFHFAGCGLYSRA